MINYSSNYQFCVHLEPLHRSVVFTDVTITSIVDNYSNLTQQSHIQPPYSVGIKITSINKAPVTLTLYI